MTARAFSSRAVRLAAVLAAAIGCCLLPAGMAQPVAAAAAGATAEWTWPLDPPPQVVRGFEPPATRYGPGHRGVDLAGMAGAAVLAAGSGVVGFAGSVAGRGVVTVVHGGLRTTYEPVEPLVTAGEVVLTGEPIGVLRTGGHCGMLRACLHWGLLRGEEYLDPLALLSSRPARLLPVWGIPLPYSARVPPDPPAAAGGAPAAVVRPPPDRRGLAPLSPAAAPVPRATEAASRRDRGPSPPASSGTPGAALPTSGSAAPGVPAAVLAAAVLTAVTGAAALVRGGRRDRGG